MDKIGLKWVGDGSASITGVPARDLSPEEAKRFQAKIAATEENTGRKLYAPVKAAAKKTVKDGG